MNIQTNKNINAILFFANKAGNKINRLKLMKLLWFSDRIHLNRHGRLILKDSYNALPHGPVPSVTMDYSKANIADKITVSGKYDIIALTEFDEKFFSKSDLDIMNFIWETLGGLTQFKLRDISHKFPEWVRYEKELTDEFSPKSYPMVMDDFFLIPNDSFSEFFSNKDNLEKFTSLLSVSNSEDSKSHYRAHNAIQSNLNEPSL